MQCDLAALPTRFQQIYTATFPADDGYRRAGSVSRVTAGVFSAPPPAMAAHRRHCRSIDKIQR